MKHRVEVIGARGGMPGTPCAFRNAPSHAYLTVMSWPAGRGPARGRHERVLMPEQLEDHGRPASLATTG